MGIIDAQGLSDQLRMTSTEYERLKKENQQLRLQIQMLKWKLEVEQRDHREHHHGEEEG
jgi:hypothetical protein